MKEKLQEFELYRQQVCKKANTFLWIGILCLVLGFVLLFVFSNAIGENTDVGAVFIIPIIISIIFFVINSSMKNKINQKFKNEFVFQLVKSIYPNAVYNPGAGISKDVIMEAGFFQYPDRWQLEDYLSCSHEGVEFEMSDFEFQERHVTRDSKGHTRVTYITYAKGRFMIFDFKRDFTKVVKILENTPYGCKLGGLEKVETESIEFNEKFKTFSTDAMTAFYVLTPQIQLKLLELESKFKGSIYFAFMRGKLYVAITDGVSILDIDASKKISEKTIEILESQLLLPVAIINELGLSKDKYSTGDAI